MINETPRDDTATADAMLAASRRRAAAMPTPLPIPLAPRRDLPIRRRTHSRRHRAISSYR